MSSSKPSTVAARPGIFQRLRSGIARAIEGRAQIGAGVSITSEEAARYFGGAATISGMAITEQSSMTISTFYACVRNIADDTSKCSIIVGRKQADGSREILEEHPLSYLLNVAPNPEMGAKVFRETLIAHAASWGNGYAEIQWRADGEPGAIWPLDPSQMVVRRSGGALRYFYSGRPVDAANLIHVPGLGFDGRIGYSVARIARESLGQVMATEQFGAAFFANGARPSGAMKHPGKLSDPAYARLKESLSDEHGGVMNAGRPLLLEEGMEWSPMTVPPEEAQFLLTRQFNVPEVCRWFRMPPHKVAHLLNATFSNIEHQSIEYVVDCLHGWFVRLEQELQRKCLGKDRRLYVKHNVNSLLRGDVKSRYEAHAIGRQWGWLSANDVLRLEDQDPIEEGGDIYLSPSNMIDSRKLEAEDPEDPEDPAPTDPAADPIDPADPPEDAAADAADAAEEMASRAAAMIDAMREAWIEALGAIRRVEQDKAARAEAKGPSEFASMADGFLCRHSAHVLERARSLAFTAIAAIRAAMPAVGELAAKTAAARAASRFAEAHTAGLAAGPDAWRSGDTGIELAANLRALLIEEMGTIWQERKP